MSEPRPRLVRTAVQQLNDAERNEIYEAAKHADHEIPALQAMPIAELHELARREQLEGVGSLTKQELIFQLLRKRVTRSGLGWGEGVLDVLPDGFGFLRSRRYSYTPGPDDIYVSPSQIRRLGLRQGHLLAGPVRPPKEGEKYFALLHVEAVNGRPIDGLRQRIPFDELVPLSPTEPLWLEHPGCPIDVRLIDLLAPIGRGQRVLVSTPPLTGRSLLLTDLARAILHNHPDVYVILLLVDERPEDVTETTRDTGPDDRREVVASTFDEPAGRHVALAELVTEKARRMVEAGDHVVVILDSLTQLVRAYNTDVPHSGKILTPGLDAVALHKPKRLFGSARKVEEGGSLTVIATCLTDTGSRLNEVVAEEFQGRANSEIVIDRELAELHVYPALDVGRTGTRREERLLGDRITKVRALRRELSGLGKRAALDRMLELAGHSQSNDELLAAIQPGPGQ